jgi:tyrosinase
MPYWDWAVDHQFLETSSIWSPYTGFGGDGSPALPEAFGKGRCVVDGPFANITRLWWDGRENPHCLGRGFLDAETLERGKLSGTWFSPERIGEVTRSETYFEFEKRLENTAHNALHWGIRGDFSSMTSANEPLFWLHHGQLDRLWWRWQGENMDVRTKEYQGVSFNTTEGRKKQGTLNDSLRFPGLWRDIKVSEVMETEGKLLCYRY